MRKILVLGSLVLLVAAGCTASQEGAVDTDANQQSAGKVEEKIPPTSDIDSIIDNIQAEVDAQTSVQNSSDADITASDETINNYSEVYNAQ